MPEWSIDDSLPLPRNSIVKTQRSKAHAVATDVCLIGTWSGGRLPIYTRLFFDSIVRNHGYLHLYLFHDVGPELGLNNHKPSGNSDYPNVDFIDIAMIDSSLLFRGFPGFVADRICQIWPNTTTEQCQRLEKAASQTKNLMTQLRGAYGSIFEPWAWTDLDMVYGKMDYFFRNDLTRESDIWTVGAGDLHRNYLRGQFTVHNLAKPDSSVNRLWEKCSYFSSVEAMIAAFGKTRKLAADEGCYSKAVLEKSNTSVTVFHWQLASWGSSIFGGKATSILLLDNTILACTLKTRKQCEYFYRSILSVKQANSKNAKRLPLEIEFQSLSLTGLLSRQQNNEPLISLEPDQIFSREPLRETIVQSRSNLTRCSTWIPKKYRSCVANTFGELGITLEDLTKCTLISRQSGSKHIRHERYPPATSSLYSENHGGFLSGTAFVTVARPLPRGGMIEIPLLHFQTWKKLLKPRCAEPKAWDGEEWTAHPSSDPELSKLDEWARELNEDPADSPWIEWSRMGKLLDAHRRCQMTL